MVLIEYADFECPFCRSFFRNTLPRLEDEFVATGKLRYVFHNFPLEHAHSEALAAAVAGVCAGRQQKFWEMHDRMLRADHSLDSATLEQQARDIGLNLADWHQCIQSADVDAKVRDDVDTATSLGIAATPTLLIGTLQSDGTVRVRRVLQGAQPFEALEKVLYSLSTSSAASP